MTKFCSVATQSDAPAIEELRRREYEAHPSLILTDENALKWSSDDDAGLVLAVWDSSECVATMRGSAFLSLTDAERALEQALKHIPIAFPTLLLGRAATASDWQGNGLNSLLRFHFLRLALSQKFGSLIGLTMAKAPRLRLLKELGWHSYPGTPTICAFGANGDELIVLDLAEQGMSTLARLEERTREIAALFPWRNDEPERSLEDIAL